MKKYILIYSQERELSVKGVFDTLSEAQIAMRKDFQNYFLEDIKMPEEEYYEILEEQCQDECTGSCYMGEVTAWSNYKMNLDWQIQEIEI